MCSSLTDKLNKKNCTVSTEIHDFDLLQYDDKVVSFFKHIDIRVFFILTYNDL